NSILVPRIRMAHHAGARIVPEHARDALVGGLGAVADDDQTGVLAVAHADAAAVVEADPGGAAGSVEQRVEDGPVADGVAAVAHGFGFAVGAGDGAGIQVIAADHDRRLQLTVAHHFVEGQTQLVTLAQADPADARRQALEADAFLGHVQPAVQVRVVGNQFLDLPVGLVDVFR